MCLGAEALERDKVEVRGGEHHLDADQDENRVTSAQRGEKPNAEQCCGNDEEDLECQGHGAANLIG